jgi:hypothetical protein
MTTATTSALLDTRATAQPLRIPEAGNQVVFEGRFSALLVKVHTPGDPAALADLVVYHGSAPEAKARVRHDAASGWCWPDEVPASPPTTAQVLEAARAKGVRVPRVGDPAVLIQRQLDPRNVVLWTMRAQIAAVHSPTVVDLAIFRFPEPPEDSREPDPLGLVRKNVRIGTQAESWNFGDWTPPRPVPIAGPRHGDCPRCARPMDSCLLELLAGFTDRQLGLSKDDPCIKVCRGCVSEILRFSARKPEPVAVT